jgi:hypothetical protein
LLVHNAAKIGEALHLFKRLAFLSLMGVVLVAFTFSVFLLLRWMLRPVF